MILDDLTYLYLHVSWQYVCSLKGLNIAAEGIALGYVTYHMNVLPCADLSV